MVVGAVLGGDGGDVGEGFGGEGGDGAQAIRQDITDRLPEADRVGEGLAVGVRIPQEGQRLIEAGALEEGVGLAGAGRPAEDPDHIFLVVEVAGQLAPDLLFDPATEAIVAVGRDPAIGQVDAGQLVLHIIEVGRRLGGEDCSNLAGQIPIRIVGVGEGIIGEEAVGGL